MATPILATKLHIPPATQRLVPRPRLLEKLNADLWEDGGFARKLTIVSAPAGFGKTTLVSQWLYNQRFRFSWLALDEQDNDPARFLAYLIAALTQVGILVGEDIQSLLRSPQPPPPDAILTVLVNEIDALATPFYLVLDDYHLIHSPPVHHQINFLLEHQPACMHLVIVTREDPPVPVTRLRARGQVVEIRQVDLSFTPQEVAEFLLKTAGLNLPPEDIQTLASRTEGWAVGLQLAALSLKGASDQKSFIQSFSGSHRYVLDYLIEEVLDRQPGDIQEFLLKTSILERLSAPLCEALTGRQDSYQILEGLETANLFIVPLDHQRQWYAYHRLFAELLRHRLRLSKKVSIESLHLQASLWFEQNGYREEAVGHALLAQNWERATKLIGQTADDLLKRGELITLIGWYQRVPEELIRSQPDFGLSYVWALLLLGRFDEAEELLADYEGFGQSAPVLLGQVANAQAFVARARGDNLRLVEKSEQALRLLPEGDVLSRSVLSLNLGLVYWHEGQLREAEPVLNNAYKLAMQTANPYGSLTAQIFLTRTLASQGALRQAEGMLHEILQVGRKIPILALAHYDLAGIYYEWDDLVKAWQHMELGLEMSTRSGNVEFQNGGHLLKSCLLMAQGDLPGALAEAETSQALSQDYGPATQSRSMACHAQVALAMGDLAVAKQWVEKMTEDVDVHSFYRFIGLTQARLLLTQGEKAAAWELLQERRERATRAGWGYALVAIRALLATAVETEDAGLQILAEGLELSQPEGFIRAYVEAGAGLIPLLRESARRGILPDYVGQILGAYDLKPNPSLPLIEPLSERELEVLRLVTAGLSNREIAKKLFISPGTAKTHVHNICGKLGVRNRTEAAMRAKELELV